MTWEMELVRTQRLLAEARVDLAKAIAWQTSIADASEDAVETTTVYDAKCGVRCTEGFADWVREQIRSNTPYSLDESLRGWAAQSAAVAETYPYCKQVSQ